MALTRVQATGKATADNTFQIVFAFASPPTVGNAIVVLLSAWRSSFLALPPTGCSDNTGAGHTYAQAVVLISGVVGVTAYYLPKVLGTASPFTLTINVTNTGSYLTAAAIEVGGLGSAALAVDRTTSSSGSGTAVSTGTTAALTAAEVFVAAAHSANADGTHTVQVVTPTWTEEYDETGISTAHQTGEGDTRILTGASGTTTSCAWTNGASSVWAAALAAFASAAPAAVAPAETYVWGPV